MKNYYQLTLERIQIWPDKDTPASSVLFFKWKIPFLGGDAYSKNLSIGPKLSKNTK